MLEAGNCSVSRPLFIITGLSGAGKSTALRAFEDMNYFTVDGLPASMIGELTAMMSRPSMSHFKGMAIGMDMRQDNFLLNFREAFANATFELMRPRTIFLEAEEGELFKRYASTRRPHPLERTGIGLEAAIGQEKSQLAGLRASSDIVLDSTGLSIHDLRREIQKLGQDGSSHRHRLRIILLSFGFKHGLPHDADFVFDLRFLPNPYFVEELRPLTGKDQAVASYIFGFNVAKEFQRRLMDFLIFTLKEMETEGRSRLTIALGCTGGRHRSVAMAEEIAHDLRQADYMVALEHRVIGKGDMGQAAVCREN